MSKSFGRRVIATLSPQGEAEKAMLWVMPLPYLSFKASVGIANAALDAVGDLLEERRAAKPGKPNRDEDKDEDQTRAA